MTHGVQPLNDRRVQDIREPPPHRSTNHDMSHSSLQYVNPTGRTADPELLRDAQDMVIRDRNHPSVVIWSLCNELGCVANDPNGSDIAAQFKRAILAADRSRPITGNTVQDHFFTKQGSDCGTGDAVCGRLTDEFADVMDVQSFSYNYDAYLQYHAITPWKPVGGGESCSCRVDRGVFVTNISAGHMGAGGDLFKCIAQSWSPVAENEFVYGNFLWTGFDYRGETSGTGWPAVSSHFGVFDNVGFPKVGVGYYRSWWRENGGREIAISPDDWTAPVTVGEKIDVFVSTAAHSASLYVNGVKQSPGFQQVPKYSTVNWTVPFVRGNLTAVAYDAEGAVTATHSVLSSGPPAQLKLSVAAPYFHGRNASRIIADGRDVALVTVMLLDAAGNVVPDADLLVSFSITGPGTIIGTANGDPASHLRSTSPICPTFHGLLRAFIRSSGYAETGLITVEVKAPGVVPSNIVLHAVRQ